MTNNAVAAGCIITGVAGFVGSHLAERLLGAGCEVVGVDNFFSGYRRNMEQFRSHPRFHFYERSITEPDLVRQLKELHPVLSRLYNLAAVVSVPYSVEHPEQTMDVNYRATLSMLEETEKLGFERFVFAGSAAEYGDDERLPLLEDYPSEDTKHLSPYGRAKFMASRAVAARPQGVALRCFNIYGPRQDPSSPYSGVISRFIDMAIENKPLTIFGDGLQTRDFVHVSDVVEAYFRAGGIGAGPHADTVPPGIYNIGTGRRTSILELAEVVRDLAGSKQPITFRAPRQGDIRHSLGSVDLFATTAGWRPRLSVREGLKDTIEWARSRTDAG
jgi:UDP-glucose 4-epimerase